LQQAAGEYLLITGHIVNGEIGELEPVYVLTLTDPPPASEPGPYQLALFDEDGHTLATRSFAAEQLPAENGLETFHEAIPFVAGIRRIALSRGVAPLAERTAGASAPTVAIDAPQAGESWAADEEHMIAWTAGDPDGDALVFLVQYSRDDGASWQ